MQDIIIQDGEGTVLGPIKGLYTLKDDSILLIREIAQEYVVFIIDSGGRLLQKIVIPLYKYPDYTDSEKINARNNEEGAKNVNIIGIIKTVVPSYARNYLYVQVDYHRQVFEKDGDMLNIDLFDSKIFRINIETNSYDKEINISDIIPKNVELQGLTKNEELVLANYFGATTGNVLQDSLFQPIIYFINTNGHLQKEYRLKVPEIDFFDYNVNIDEQGNIVGYFLLLDRVEFYWWRK